MAKQVEIRYKCKCMDSEGSFHIRARGKTETIEEFMPRMQLALSRDHRNRSPLCRSDKTEYVKIHLPESGTVGGVDGGEA